MVSRAKQQEFEFRSWGGAREGAGRKPKGARAGVPHRSRAALASRYPVHVTLKRGKGLPALRSMRTRRVLWAAFEAGKDRFGFRLTHFSIQGDHIHLIVEAKNREALTRGMSGLCIRIAKRLNKLWRRRGKVFPDRFHDHILRTPREVKNALVYVLHNAKHHGLRLRQGIDEFASGPWFNGWKEPIAVTDLDDYPIPVAKPHTWLLNIGWRRYGLVRALDSPR